MNPQSFLLRALGAVRGTAFQSVSRNRPQPRPCSKCGQTWLPQRRYANTPADDPYFESIVDNPPILVKSGQKHGPGLIVLCKLYNSHTDAQ